MIKTETITFRMIRILALALLTLGFLVATHPARVPATMLVLPFAGIFAFLYYVIMEIIRLVQPAEEEGERPASVRRPRLLAAIFAAFPVLLLVLQSIMELNRWDVLIALAILLLAYVFVSRGTLPVGR